MNFSLTYPGFTLEHNEETGETITRFGYYWSGCFPVPDDAYHAERLGITAGQHRFLHELMHHEVGMAFGFGASPVVWRDAFKIPQESEAKPPATDVNEEAHAYLTATLEEWIVNSCVYKACGREYDAGAMMDVERICGAHAVDQLETVARGWLVILKTPMGEFA